MAYTCNNSEFVYFNKDGKTIASGYKIDCNNLNTRQPIMSTNINTDLINMGMPVGLVVKKDDNYNPINYETPSNKITDEDLYQILLNKLSMSQQMQYNIKTRRNKNYVTKNNKTSKSKPSKPSKSSKSNSKK